MKKVISDLKINNDKVNLLMSKEKKQPKILQTHFKVDSPGFVQQADLLFLPSDNNFKYLLTVIDVNNNSCDAEPLKTKLQKDIVTAFKKIYRRKYLKFPKYVIQFDNGNEFKGLVKSYFEDNNCNTRYAATGRHRQQGVIEHLNLMIGKLLFYKMNATELETKTTDVKWVYLIKPLIKSFNKHLIKDKSERNNELTIFKDNQVIIPINTEVHVLLNEPVDIVTNKKLHGRFRAGDIKYTVQSYPVEDHIIVPNQPLLYKIKGFDKNLFTRSALLTKSTFNKSAQNLTL